jgi:hypothetical protein
MEDSPTTCASCSNSLDSKGEFYVLKGKKGERDKVLCSNCMTQMEDTLRKEVQDPNLPLALLAGLSGAALGAVVWYLLVRFTGWQVGIVAVLVGWLAGKGVVIGSGQKRGTNLQVLSVILTVIAMLASEYFVFNYFFHEAGFSGNIPVGDFLGVYRSYLFSGDGFLTIVFYAIAIWQAFVTPAPRKLKVELGRYPSA